MRDLSKIEKQEHYQKLDELVHELNSEHRFLTDNGLKICHVCYMIPIDNIFLYYDYPFKIGKVEQFNMDLNNPDLPICQTSNNTLKRFRDAYKKGENGFIFYKYQFDNKLKQYQLYDFDSNLVKQKANKLLYDYLPIAHYASNLKGSYNSDVIYTPSTIKTNFKQLLTLYRPFKSINESLADTSLAISIEINQEQTFNKSLLDKIEKIVMIFFKNYFDSPVLEKVLFEKRKSYILGYYHNLGQLQPTSCFENIEDDIENKNYYSAKKNLETLRQIVKQYTFTHHLMFDYEFVNAGFSTYNVKFRNKSISQILKEIDSDFNDCEDKTIFNFEADYFPIFDTQNHNYELFDFILILWNLWINCLTHKIDGPVCINSWKDSGGKTIIAFTNSGEMNIGFRKFLNEKSKPYPNKINYENNPYPGLLITRDLIKKNSNLDIRAEVLDKNTVIKLIIKR